MSCLVVSPVAGGVVVAIICSLVNSELPSSPRKTSLALDSRHQLLDLDLLIAAERQERQPRRASIIAVDVHSVFHAGDAEFTDHALGSQLHTLLFLARESGVSFFERGVDFVTCHGRRTGEGENRACRSQSKRRFQLVSRADHDLEADFFLAGLQFSYDGY